MLLLLLAGAGAAGPAVEVRLGSVTITGQARLNARISSSIVTKK